MSTLFYSPSAEKMIATYLNKLTDKELGAAVLPYALDKLAHETLKQIMRDNDGITGYSTTWAEIQSEKEA